MGRLKKADTSFTNTLYSTIYTNGMHFGFSLGFLMSIRHGRFIDIRTSMRLTFVQPTASFEVYGPTILYK